MIRHHPRPWSGVVRSGEEVLVTLRIASDTERRYVMLEDFFPAGAALRAQGRATGDLPRHAGPGPADVFS